MITTLLVASLSPHYASADLGVMDDNLLPAPKTGGITFQIKLKTIKNINIKKNDYGGSVSFPRP